MDVPARQNFDFRYIYLFSLTTHQYTNFVQNTPSFAQIGCILQYFAQITPNLCKLGTLVMTPSPITTKICKKAPRKAAT